MPTVGRTLAKTRTQVIQQAIIEGNGWAISPDYQPFSVLYYGRTSDNTLTELFIHGKGPAAVDGTTYRNRLFLPESTLICGTATYLSWNQTDDTFFFAQSYFAASNVNGTTAAHADLNKSGATNDLEIFLDFDATSGDLDFNHPGSITYALAVDDTDDFLRVNVTGVASKVIYHKVVLSCYTINETECASNYFFGDTAAQSTGS